MRRRHCWTTRGCVAQSRGRISSANAVVAREWLPQTGARLLFLDIATASAFAGGFRGVCKNKPVESDETERATTGKPGRVRSFDLLTVPALSGEACARTRGLSNGMRDLSFEKPRHPL